MARGVGRRSAAAVLAGLVLVAGSPQMALAGTWVKVGGFPFAGYTGYTQTLLRDGRVLIAGGKDPVRGISGNCWIFDPEAGTWTQTATMKDARAFHSATLLDDGTVLVAGGEGASNTALGTLEIFDPAGTGSWTKLGVTLTHPRWGHTATRLATGTDAGSVLIVGGRTGTGVVGQAELFVPGSPTPTVVSAGTLTAARYDHTATRLSNGDVIVVGGLNKVDQATATSIKSVERYTPGTGGGSWAGAGSLPDGGRHGQSTVALGDLWLGVFGGYTDAADASAATNVDLYYEGTNTWTNAGVLTTTTGPVAAAVFLAYKNDNEVLVESSGSTTPSASDFTRLAGGNLSKSSGDTMNGAYVQPVMTLLESGRILVTGSASDGTGSAEVSDPGSAARTPGATETPCLGRSAVAPLPDGSVVSLGGLPETGTPISDAIERFGPDGALTVEHWGTTTPSPAPPGRMAAVAAPLLDGRVLVAGGIVANNAAEKTTLIYDPTDGSMTAGHTMRTARSYAAAAVLHDGSVAIVGGTSSSTAPVIDLLDPGATGFTSYGSNLGDWEGMTVTVLDSGKVLIAGGQTDTSVLIFDPSSDTFVQTASDTTIGPHQHGTATLLADGRVLLAGGLSATNQATKTAEIYVPNVGWVQTSSMPQPRAYAAAIRLEDGEVLVAGGQDTEPAGSTDLKTTVIYDPVDGTWRAGPNLGTARRSPRIARLQDGSVLVFGGIVTDVTGHAADVLSGPAVTKTRISVIAPMPLAQGGAIDLGGAFALLDTGDGTLRAGSTDVPRVRLESRTGGEDLVVPLGAVTASSLSGTVPAATPLGPYYLRVDGSGQPGIGVPVEVTTATCGTDAQVCSSPGTCVQSVCCTTACTFGTCESDGGCALGDGGVVPVDGGSGDGGTPADAGSGDAGTPVDAGTGDGGAVTDGGTGDGGAIADGGSGDGGTVTDGGTGIDGGTVADGGATRDGGTMADGGTGANKPALYGCLCGQGGSSPGWAVFLLVLVLLRLDRRRRLGLFTILIATALVASPAHAASPAHPPAEKVAVLELQSGPGVTDKLAAIITESLTAAIQARGPKVLSAQDIKATLGFEAEKQVLGCKADSACLAQIGGALGVDHVVAGSLARIGDSYVMNVELLDIANASVVRRYSHRTRGGTAEAFLDAVGPAAAALFPNARTNPSPVARGPTGPIGLTVGLRGQVVPAPPAAGAFALYLGWRVLPVLTVAVGGLVARPFGAYLRVQWIPFAAGHRLHPILSAEVPVLFSSPVAIGMSLSPGVAFAATRWLDLEVEVPVSYELTAPANARRLWVFVAGGVSLRL